MATSKIYPKGITFFPKKENAPEWVVGNIIISPEQLEQWLRDNASILTYSEKYGKQLKLQVTDKGLQVDTWKKTQ